VTLVDWGDRSVTLETSGGTLTARAAIITASTAVLTSGKIKFKPNLPAPYLKALDTLKLGTYDKVAIEFDGNALRLGANEVVFERALNGKAAALFANVHGTRLSSLILAGKNGAELADKGASAMTDCALDWVSDLFGSSVSKPSRIFLLWSGPARNWAMDLARIQDWRPVAHRKVVAFPRAKRGPLRPGSRPARGLWLRPLRRRSIDMPQPCLSPSSWLW
jgi:hypothetical protein